MGRTARPSAAFLAKSQRLSTKSTKKVAAKKTVRGKGGKIAKISRASGKPNRKNVKNNATKASPKVKPAQNVRKAINVPKATVNAAKKRSKTGVGEAPVVGRKRPARLGPSNGPAPMMGGCSGLSGLHTLPLQAGYSTPANSKSSAAHQGKTYKLDAVFKRSIPANAKIHADYCCMLNQTNIGKNNNKFFVIQLAETSSGMYKYSLFTRWGRVGEEGQYQSHPCDLQNGIKDFEKKFYDKTQNVWSQRNKFKAVPGKYTLLDMEEEEGEEDEDSWCATPAPATATSTSKAQALKSKLDGRTQKMARLIFSEDMFCSAMKNMSLDVKKMPLGKLSKAQIGKGFDALINIEKAIKQKKGREELMRLSSVFYTLVPHSFGRALPPLISTADQVQQKKDMLNTLTDIELTQSLQKNKNVNVPTKHPLDARMEALGCSISPVDKTSKEFQWIKEFAKACPNSRKCTLLDVWKVDRDGEHSRFCKNSGVTYRKLLWHGTSVAVVAAILNSGLRIMPHSGGRVGRGIYFASEHAKSSFYVGCHYGKFEEEQNVGFMFLVEVALGRTKEIVQGDGSLTAPPKGFDSIVARGWTEPDAKEDMTMKLEGKTVIVPKGKPKSVSQFSNSSFSQSEYLVYREDQARLRYMLKFSFA